MAGMNCEERCYNCFCRHAVSIFIAPHQSFKCAGAWNAAFHDFEMLSKLSTPGSWKRSEY